MKGLILAITASVILFWTPLTLLIFAGAGTVGAWWAGVAVGVLTAFAGRGAGEAIRQHERNIGDE